MRLIKNIGITATGAIIDVGGGASTLVDEIMARGYTNVAVLDISAAALAEARKRLGERARTVHWMIGDVTTITLPEWAWDIWHDKAVFRFPVTVKDRQAYVKTLLSSLRPGGHVIIATFAEDGPTSCIGLAVQRYSSTELQGVLGGRFRLEHLAKETHGTPMGTAQNFNYCYFCVR